jgi:CMP-N-acetylneuraminic acid synthetase
MTRYGMAAVVPMRHDSERVKGKNYRDFGGRPLYQHIVDTLLRAGCVDCVIIDTDSDIIRESCSRDFPDVLLLERPEHLRAGETPMNEVLLNTVEQVPAEFYLQTHSTNPLLRPSTVRSAVDAFHRARPGVDSLFTVTRLQTRLWDSLTRPVNHNPAFLLRTQDLPPLYEENSCMYIFSADVLRHERNRLGRRPLMWPIPGEEALDIDEELDFTVAEMVYSSREEA